MNCGCIPMKEAAGIMKGLIAGVRSVNPPLESCMMETLGEESVSHGDDWIKALPLKKASHKFPKVINPKWE